MMNRTCVAQITEEILCVRFLDWTFQPLILMSYDLSIRESWKLESLKMNETKKCWKLGMLVWATLDILLVERMAPMANVSDLTRKWLTKWDASSFSHTFPTRFPRESRSLLFINSRGVTAVIYHNKHYSDYLWTWLSRNNVL